ncbi:MAG: TlpA family protein disulfide reductase [Pyrinomonadaceae bacterium]
MQGISAGQPAPAFSITGLDGQVYDLAQLRGKVVLVTFWSTRCAICHSEIPKLNQLATKYKGQDVVFLGFTMDSPTKVENYLRSTPFRFTIVPNSFGVVLQYADKDKAGTINMGFPAYFLLDQDGTVQIKSSGWDRTSDLDARIAALLAAQKPRDVVAEKR